MVRPRRVEMFGEYFGFTDEKVDVFMKNISIYAKIHRFPEGACVGGMIDRRTF